MSRRILNIYGEPMLTFDERFDDCFFSVISDELHEQLNQQMLCPAAWVDLPRHTTLQECLKVAINATRPK